MPIAADETSLLLSQMAAGGRERGREYNLTKVGPFVN
jgi:hypothetical protein